MFGARITYAAAAIGIAAIISYAAYQARFLITGPSLAVDAPKDGEVFRTPLITVSGSAPRTIGLSINGRQVFTDEGGSFATPLLLHPGHTIIEIRAKDRFGRERSELREVVYTDAEAPNAPSAESAGGATTTKQ